MAILRKLTKLVIHCFNFVVVGCLSKTIYQPDWVSVFVLCLFRTKLNKTEMTLQLAMALVTGRRGKFDLKILIR